MGGSLEPFVFLGEFGEVATLLLLEPCEASSSVSPHFDPFWMVCVTRVHTLTVCICNIVDMYIYIYVYIYIYMYINVYISMYICW